MTKTIIITAGGKGLRMGTEVPKQFLRVLEKPILFYTIEQFYKYDPKIEIILVLPSSQIEYWRDLVKQYDFAIQHTIVNGGETRYHSIKNGLHQATGTVVGVHDGVRPFVSVTVISKVFEAANTFGAAIPVMPLVESIRKIDDHSSTAEDRSKYCTVQTPQCFQAITLKKAYEKPYRSVFTDDASVVEASGAKINLVPGNSENIKITTPFDLEVAKLLAGK